MRRSILLTICAAGAVALGACTDSAADKKNVATPLPAASPSASPAVSPSVSPSGSPAADDKGGKSKAESLAGRWPGVEGTYLNITKKAGTDGKYTIEIANLDGAQTFEGTAKGDVIEFIREGKTETIKAATGEETGMKHLLKEKNCVVVTKGSEGFCRKS